MAARNTILWEARLNMVDTSRKQYRLEDTILIYSIILYIR